eukprot:TRINITY_DN49205_c0_g1_i1.p1 TRINITY_DN49205_c0_g1~~TRINITY_DN49205_c0_g1_i1.p1  ORF type:complete len:239 (-),score=46.65 TRINITY_DN49205_c0_g1_i1:67-723(-)
MVASRSRRPPQAVWLPKAAAAAAEGAEAKALASPQGCGASSSRSSLSWCSTFGEHDGGSLSLSRASSFSSSSAPSSSTPCCDRRAESRRVGSSLAPLSLAEVSSAAAQGEHRAVRALAQVARLSEEKREDATWAMMHRLATIMGRDQYVDPVTGRLVFTATFLKRQERCCGYSCRHCPYLASQAGQGAPPIAPDRAAAEAQRRCAVSSETTGTSDLEW